MIFDIWVRLLHQVDGVLWLPQGNEVARHNLGPEAEKRGVPANRLVFAKRTAFEKSPCRGGPTVSAIAYVDEFSCAPPLERPGC